MHFSWQAELGPWLVVPGDTLRHGELLVVLEAGQCARGLAEQMAAILERAAVIDPAPTRHRLVQGLTGARVAPAVGARFGDAW